MSLLLYNCTAALCYKVIEIFADSELICNHLKMHCNDQFLRLDTSEIGAPFAKPKSCEPNNSDT